MGQPFVNKAKLTFKLTNSAERCVWFKLRHVMPYFLVNVTRCKKITTFFSFVGIKRPDLGPNTLKSIQIHYNYFDLSMITITLQLQDL